MGARILIAPALPFPPPAYPPALFLLWTAAPGGDEGGDSDDGDELLLGMKKRGFGMGKWNGETARL